jgi:acyl-coenzyme A thioesterase PaaI-like protein
MTDDEVEAMFTPAPPCSQLLSWRLLEHDVTRGWIKVGFGGRAEFLNPAGRVQGGILTAMLDDTMGPAVLVKSEGAL